MIKGVFFKQESSVKLSDMHLFKTVGPMDAELGKRMGRRDCWSS